MTRAARLRRAQFDDSLARLWLDLRGAEPDLRSVVVTGCRGGEGASATAMALADTLGKPGGPSVVVVDADPARNGLSRRLRLSRREGLRQLHGGSDPAGFIVRNRFRADILPVGIGSDPLPTDDALRGLQRRLLETHDLVFWDSAPVSLSVDTKRLICLVGRVILVTQSEVTRAETLSASLNEIASLKARAAAVLRNRAGRTMFSIGAGRG